MKKEAYLPRPLVISNHFRLRHRTNKQVVLSGPKGKRPMKTEVDWPTTRGRVGEPFETRGSSKMMILSLWCVRGVMQSPNQNG